MNIVKQDHSAIYWQFTALHQKHSPGVDFSNNVHIVPKVCHPAQALLLASTSPISTFLVVGI